MSLEVQLLLVLWGTVVGLDLVSVPQTMIARPIVAGVVAGFIQGDVDTGLRLGVLFELMQYDILPVGAVRYPEYGPATVAAVSAAHFAASAGGIGLGAVVGFLTAMLGGVSLHELRKLNARRVRLAAPRLEAGDARVLVRVHAAAIGRDAIRAALVTAIGLGLAWVARELLGIVIAGHGVTLLALAATAVAIATGVAGTLRLAGPGAGLRWFTAGVVGGTLVAALR
ncbi:MAG TPA: PTS sugar transporter subunit IIC [Gemmatimonadales bacterium]|nr:PTS sugar transporter subunit IIC [Gemmatimonadales bacterium]